MTAALQGLSEKLVKRQLCDWNDVTQLRAILFDDLHESKRPRSAAATSRAAPKRTQAHSRAKSTAKATLPKQEISKTLSVQQRHAIATDAVNYALATLGKVVQALDPSKGLRNETSASKVAHSEVHSKGAESAARQTSPPNLDPSAHENGAQEHHFAAAAEIGQHALNFLQTPEPLNYSKFYSGNHAQLVGGILAFCGKCMALDLREAAMKQLESLHTLLANLQAPSRDVKGVALKARPKSADVKLDCLASLLGFNNLNYKDASLLDHVCSYQLLVLRLLASNPVATTLEAALPHLDCANRTSLVNVLLHRSRNKDAEERVTSQLQTVSKILTHCADKLTHSANNRASIAGLSFRLHVLSLCVRMAWSNIRGHKKNMDKDFISPLVSSLSVYMNATRDDAQQRLNLVQSTCRAMEDFASQHSSVNEPRLTRSRNLRLLLGCLIYDSGDINEAQQTIDDALRSQNSSGNQIHGDSLHFIAISRLGRQAFASDNTAEELEEAWAYVRQASDLLQEGPRDSDAGFELTIREATLLRNGAYDYMRKFANPEFMKRAEYRERSTTCFSILSHFNLLILRTLSLRANPQAEAVSRALEARQALVLRIVKQSCEAAINMTRVGFRYDLLSSEAITLTLKTCKRILHCLSQNVELSSWNDVLDSSTLGILRAELAKLHFQVVKTGNQSRDALSDGLKLIQSGLELCDGMSKDDRRLAQLSLAYYRKGRLLLKAHADAFAHDSFSKCILEYIASGIVLEAADLADSLPLSAVLDSSSDMHIFISANKALLELEIRDGSNLATMDFGNCEPRAKAIVLECRLSILSEWSSKHLKKESLRRSIMQTVEDLLECYQRPVHPLRNILLRARALQIFADSGIAANENTLTSEIISHNEDLREDLREDEGLAVYREHITATFEASKGLYAPITYEKNLSRALGMWISILTSGNSWNEIKARIYDLDTWLAQLEAMADCFEMLGYDDDRLQTLAVIACVQTNSDSVEKTGQVKSLAHVGQALATSGFVSESEQWISAATAILDTVAAGTRESFAYCIAKAEWLLVTNEPKKSYEHMQILTQRLESDESDLENALPEPIAGILPSKARRMVAASQIFAICSTASLNSGNLSESLILARRSATLLEYVWRSVESQYGVEASDMDATLNAVDGLARRLSRMSISPRKKRTELTDASVIPGPTFWSLARRLFKALLHLSAILRHLGSVTGAIAANDQARKIADASGSSSLIVEALVDRAQLAWRSGHEDEAKEHFHQAESSLAQHRVQNRVRALYFLAIGEFHGHLKHWRNEQDAYTRIESVVDELTSPNRIHQVEKLLRLCGTTMEKDQSAGQRPLQVTKHSRGTSRGTSQARQPGQKVIAHGRTQSKSVVSVTPSINCSDRTEFLSRAILTQKIDSMLMQSNLVAAKKFLQALQEKCTRHDCQRVYTLLRAKALLQEALANMAAHAVYGMLPESTLSVPNVPFVDQQGALIRPAIADEGPVAGHRRQSSQAVISSRAEILDSFTLAMDAATSMKTQNNFWNTNTLSRKYEIMAACSMLFSFAGAASGMQQTNPSQLASHLDCFQNEVTSREHICIEAERVNRLAATATSWPLKTDLESSTANLSLSDIDEDLIKHLPKDWIVVSLNLREQNEHLYLTRYVADRSPFVLRLPLNRQTGDELDEETFSLEQAREELQDIVDSSNNMVHKARDAPDEMKVKGAKTQWWAERDELDGRLHSLLVNMENIWFGGFRSVFTVRSTPSTAAAKFRQSFEATLARHLPSRQPSSKRGKLENVSLDTSVLELFTGLMTKGDDGVADLDEALNDLLYFVVDILQYSGEANAYDEIDFDAMIVEIQDALLDFRDSLSEGKIMAKKKQIILVLDKKLHGFPWESMPCLDSQSVSRVPSIKDICDRIKLMQTQSFPDGVLISQQTGTYLLNPSRDLPRTQKRFEKPLSGLLSQGWSSTVGRATTEEEFELALSQGSSQFSRSMLIYIGHGSGAQYIRAKTIRRLRPHCNAALLFGCSSVKLKEAGEFEEQGTPRTYLAAGAPAVLGSLWDVTDGDVDKFAAAVLEGWGLIAAGSVEADGQQQKGKAKTKRKANTGAARTVRKSVEERMSLSEAVSKGKEHCYLRYLNGAAMVVYGVPLYLD